MINFWKYEGAGNDFVILHDATPTPEQVRLLCDRHRGVGADGVMVLSEAAGYAFRMTYYNSDGSAADMCGNGARCIALFAHHLGMGRELRFLGRDGEHWARIIDEHTVEIGMKPVAEVLRADEAYLLNTGVPHYVEFVGKVADIDVVGRGRELRQKHNANVNFAAVEGDTLYIRTYERGVEDETLACGTGATAAAIAAFRHFGRRFGVIRVAGGDLVVSFDDELKNVTLKGPARRVFDGKVYNC